MFSLAPLHRVPVAKAPDFSYSAMKTSFFAALLLLLAPGFLHAQTSAKPKAAAARAKSATPARTPPNAPTATPAADKVEARAKALTANMRQALALNRLRRRRSTK